MKIQRIPRKGERVRVVAATSDGDGTILPLGTEFTLLGDPIILSGDREGWVQLPLHVVETGHHVFTVPMKVLIVAEPAAPALSRGAELVFAATFSRVMAIMRQRGIANESAALNRAAAEAYADALGFERATGHSVEVAAALEGMRR